MTEQGTRRRSPTAAAAAHAPYLPTQWENADALSLQRLQTGSAQPHEQKRALAWILKVTGITDEAYRPGDENGRRDTDFALGKANVGRQIAKLLNLDLSKTMTGGETK